MFMAAKEVARGICPINLKTVRVAYL